MKKKIALLLAVVMVLSLLPVQTFGRSPGTAAPRITDFTARGAAANFLPIDQNIAAHIVRGVQPGNWDDLTEGERAAWNQNAGNWTVNRNTFIISIPADNFIGLTSGGSYYLRFSLSGGNSGFNHLNEVAFRGGDNWNTPLGAPPAAPEAERMHGLAGNVLRFSVPGSIEPAELRNNMQAVPNWQIAGDSATAPVLEGGSDRRTLFVPLNPRNAAGDPLVGLLNSHDDNAWQGQPVLPAARGHFSVEFDAVVRHRDAALTVEIVESMPGRPFSSVRTILSGHSLVWPGITHGANVNQISAVPSLVTHAEIPTIEIVEAGIGSFSAAVSPAAAPNRMAIRLVAPREYRWDLGRIGALGRGAFAVTANQGGTIGDLNTDVFFNNATQREELNIWFTVTRGTSAVNLGSLQTIEIDGMMLIALAGAPAGGDINIDVYVRSGAHGGFTTVNRVWRPGEAAEQRTISNVTELSNWAGTGFSWLPWNPALSDWSHHGLTVARRGVGLVNVIGTEYPARGISGTRSFNWETAGTDPEWLNRRYYTVRLADTTANSIFSGVNTWEFRLIQPGARFEAADVRTTFGDDRDDTDDTSWVSFRDANFVIPALTTLGMDLFRVTPRASFDNAAELHVLDTRFRIITEAGFANNPLNAVSGFPAGSVVVEVVGPGVTQEVVIATVVDPIGVSGGSPLPVFRDEFDILPFTSVPPVVITENSTGALGIGTELWLSATPVVDGRRTAVPTLAAMVLNVLTMPVVAPGSGLQIREIPASNMLGWEVVTPSIDGPAVITFNNVNIAGGVMTGVDYHFEVLSRDFTRTTIATASHDERLAMTHQRAAIYVETRGDQAFMAGLTPLPQDIRFDIIGYSHPILTVRGTSIGPGDLPQEQVPVPIPGRNIPAASWVAGATVTSAITGTTVPNAVQNINGNMMVSMRIASENLIRFNPDLGWQGHRLPITLRGQNAAGVPVVVVVTQDSPTATITVGGVPRTVDIADEVRALTAAAGEHVPPGAWPTGSIVVETINGFAFLPLRFLLQTFGIEFNWVDATQTVNIPAQQ